MEIYANDREKLFLSSINFDCIFWFFFATDQTNDDVVRLSIVLKVAYCFTEINKPLAKRNFSLSFDNR